MVVYRAMVTVCTRHGKVDMRILLVLLLTGCEGMLVRDYDRRIIQMDVRSDGTECTVEYTMDAMDGDHGASANRPRASRATAAD